MMTMPVICPCPSQSVGCDGSISPSFISRLFTAPACPSMARTPIAPTKGGRIIGTSTSELSKVRPGKLNFANTTASGTDTSRQPSVVLVAITREFHSPSR